MKRFPAGALALAVLLGLGACGSSADTPDTAGTSAPSATGATSAANAPTDAATGVDSGAATPGPSASTTLTAVDQTTPEAAMTSWLRAMVAGNAAGVCTVMAAEGKPIPSIPKASDACASSIASPLEELSALGAAFDGLTITGATVSGSTATFQSVTTEPAMAADVVSHFRAVKLDGKWYVTKS
ncbi:MAG: hypothetical protein ABIS35_04095 [Terracoccus sp.]